MFVCFILLIGASHLREVFYRMGLSDKDIVVLSGGHTLVTFSIHLIKVDNVFVVRRIHLFFSFGSVGKGTSEQIWL